ncbi:MAG TPA: ATP-binding protein [Burkholderiaceae bacterium]
MHDRTAAIRTSSIGTRAGFRARVRAHAGAFALAAAALLAAAVAAGPAQALTIRRLEWTPTQVGGMPAPDARWTSFELPLRWATDENSPLRAVALRMHFDLAAVPPENWALLLSQATDGGRITVNGHFLGMIPAPDALTHVRWLRPHLLAIDPPLLVAGDNELLIQTSYRAGTHTFSGIEIGPLSDMWGEYETRFFLAYTANWIGATLAAVIALIFGVLWLRRGETLSKLLTLGALIWVAQSATFMFEAMPIGLRFALQLLSYASIGAFAAVMTITLLQMSALRGRRQGWLILAYAAIGPVMLAVTSQIAAPYLDRLWLPGLVLMVAAATGLGLYRRTRGLEAPQPLVLIGAVVMIVAVALDLGTLYGWWNPFDGQRALNVAAPLLLAALATPLVDGFVKILREAETARAELETRVREREQLLKRNFERLRESERVKAEAQERQRIMQDMHDGLGSQLMSSLMLVERGAVSNEQVAQILRESIDDMRLAIDALAAEDADLGSALGNLRFRMEPRMRAAGMELLWDARNLPEEIGLHPDAVLPILRIVQEALTNSLKHSRARAVRVTLAAQNAGDSQWLDIRVTDNGRGIAEERVGGRGLLNMRNRAQRIGAQLKLETVPGAGTMVHLRTKLDPTAGPTTGSRQTALNTQAVIERARQQ